MSISGGRADTRLKKIQDAARLKQKDKRNEDLSRISSSHSETEDKLAFKVIDGEDVQCMSIRDVDLKKLNQEKLKQTLKVDPILVKKANPNAYPTTEIKVAKLVPNKQTKPIDYSDNLGIRFDKSGNCVPYSILGTVEDFLGEAVTNGRSIQLPYDTLDSDRPDADLYLKEDGEENNSKANKEFETDGGEKALKNWQFRMDERRNVQELVSRKLNRNGAKLVMNQCDNMNQKLQLASMMDRALPLIENGKGNRLGSEFWNQPFPIGDETNGIFTTLTKSERGVLPEIEQIAKPSITLQETHFNTNQPNLNHYPWSKSKYLEHRLNKLNPLIRELVPHSAEFNELQVIGSNQFVVDKASNNSETNKQDDFIDYTWVNPTIQRRRFSNNKDSRSQNNNDDVIVNNNEDEDVLGSYEDVVDEPVFGPSLMFGGQTAIWTGSDGDNEGVVALESRLNFETKAGKRVLATFEIFNTGTCAIYYEWKKIKEINPFQIVNSKEQRFYFDTRPSVVLPGDVLKLHVVFKSKKGGIFTEKWELVTRPRLLSGASLVLTLRGVALQEDKFKKRRISLEKKLFLREADIIARGIVELILSGVKTPRRSPSPDNLKLIEDQVFTNKNQSLPYDQEIVMELKTMYSNLLAEDSEANKDEWNLSLNLLKQRIHSLEENDPQKCQEKLITLNSCLEKMSLKPHLPTNTKVYSLCYNLICTSFDEIFNELSSLKQNTSIQLAPRADTYPAVDELDKKYEDWKKEFEILKQIELERKNRLDKENKGKGEKGTKKVEKKDDNKKKEKKNSQTPGGGVKSRNSISLGSRAETRSQEKISVIEERENVSPVALTEAQLKNRSIFTEKAYANVYQMLAKMVDNIEDMFEFVIGTNLIDAKKLGPSKPIIPINSDFID